MFRRLVATSRAPQIMVLSMLRSFGKIGPQIDQIWAWLSRGNRWSPGVRNPLKSSVTGPSLLVNCYLEIKFHKIIRVNPPPLNTGASRCEIRKAGPNSEDYPGTFTFNRKGVANSSEHKSSVISIHWNVYSIKQDNNSATIALEGKTQDRLKYVLTFEYFLIL